MTMNGLRRGKGKSGRDKKRKMSYKYDGMLVLANKYGIASNDAKAEMFETYDRIRDLSVSGPSLGGAGGYGAVGSFLMNLARLVGPTSYLPVLGSSSINIPGTSYYSPSIGGNSTASAQASFGMGELAKYPGFPGGAAPLAAIGAFGLPALMGIGNAFGSLSDEFTVGGMPTGGAASAVAGSSYIPAVGALTGVSASAGKYSDIVLPVAGVIGGLGGLVGSLAPYFGPFGVIAGMTGNLTNGYAGAVLSAYQSTTGKIINNADTILSMKVKNIETVVKQLDAQGDIVRKMLKTGLEADSKAVQEM